MTSETLCQFLDWDSNFFKRRIARVNTGRLTPESAAAILDWCAAERIDGLYFLADCDDAQTVWLAEDNGFRLMDVRVTLDKPLTGEESANFPYIRPCQPQDVAVLKGIARVSYHDSRFYYDAHFAREDCDALYETWVEKSCAGYDDIVLVAESDEGQAVGFMTCRLVNQSTGQLGLAGIVRDYQGRGLGSTLTQTALGWLAGHGVRKVFTLTQGRNYGSQRLFQKAGFQTRVVQLWYHRWF